MLFIWDTRHKRLSGSLIQNERIHNFFHIKIYNIDSFNYMDRLGQYFTEILYNAQTFIVYKTYSKIYILLKTN